METLQNGYINPYANQIQSVKNYYFSNKDNPAQSRFQETPEALQERRKDHSNNVFNDAKYKAHLVVREIEKKESEIKSRINSTLYPNSSSYDSNYKSIGESQLNRANQVIMSNPNKDQVISILESSIASRSIDTIGVLHEYYSKMNAKNKAELETKLLVMRKTSEFFKPFKLNEHYLELQKIEAVKPRLNDLKKLFGLS